LKKFEAGLPIQGNPLGIRECSLLALRLETIKRKRKRKRTAKSAEIPVKRNKGRKGKGLSMKGNILNRPEWKEYLLSLAS